MSFQSNSDIDIEKQSLSTSRRNFKNIWKNIKLLNKELKKISDKSLIIDKNSKYLEKIKLEVDDASIKINWLFVLIIGSIFIILIKIKTME